MKFIVNDNDVDEDDGDVTKKLKDITALFSDVNDGLHMIINEPDANFSPYSYLCCLPLSVVACHEACEVYGGILLWSYN